MEIPDLAEETYRLLKQVPRGMVTSYGALAEALGAQEASRLVGQYMASNPYAPEVPCHRVVHSDGRLGKFSSPRGVPQKIEMLDREGVAVKNGKVVDFENVLFKDFKGKRPLAELRKYQLSLLPKLRLEDERMSPGSLVAVDVAYDDEGAFAAGALYGLIERTPGPAFAVHVNVSFPYIPTFLAFREVPALKAALGFLPKRPDLLLVDGNGTLHPHGIGIACQAGIELNMPTIGVAKSLLCGTVKNEPVNVGDASEVLVDGKVLGHALRTSGSKKGIVYVSPGHRISPYSAVDIIRGLIAAGNIEPLRRAHVKAREAATSFKSGSPMANPE
jgi:deoxyribonuclease V